MHSFLKNLSSRLSVISWSSPQGEKPKSEDRISEDRIRSALCRTHANVLAQRADGAHRACAKGWRRAAEGRTKKRAPSSSQRLLEGAEPKWLRGAMATHMQHSCKNTCHPQPR